MDGKTTGIRKRQQITKSNRTMFLWVAGASLVIGFSVVIALFLWQRIDFGDKVLQQKNETLATIESNLQNVPKLRDNIRVLETDDSLKSTRLKDTDRAVQSVLDALPADANSTALGSSLQSKLLTGVNGVTLDAIKVEPVKGVETSSGSGSSSGSNQIDFSFTISAASGNAESLRQVLQQVERSIRAINLTSLTVEQQGARLVMSASGYAYYQPAQSIELKDKVVRP
ncbi:hypothetical protein A2707_05130 [Candidatus Saccharibacteria bacterium RIFCSPHIGHO2_01_FULL_45_15]|nr:MAG: hypothetical protein A2707_05130 [Candidatus Saccharibacteria bacterium RIFCSPHIGHO2_01_FULL_45_15]OGL27433.1 MAG: hypothetical protein A3C39_05360 [Candidatus Saccharibacteria bacterium RIFCSPHIGHO2_02_FULL_46_12]OGL32651.1 MAG: hypothetical protein A3E76_04835 [Candidatus Saccharibacteria bacterium RIFCSPHIGHO2_12_FULL_44_22]